MPANVSLLINVVLLGIVIFAIVKLLRNRKKESPAAFEMSPNLGVSQERNYDDIIAVRKLAPEPVSPTVIEPALEIAPEIAEVNVIEADEQSGEEPSDATSLIILIKAKADRPFTGYTLLQSLLSAGLRYGEGQLFHRHQFANGQGPVMCSLAAATATGAFDLQNIGAFTAKGLCLFLDASGNPTIDAERFSMMLDTARLLKEDLDAQLLDDSHDELNDHSVARYCHRINVAPIAMVA